MESLQAIQNEEEANIPDGITLPFTGTVKQAVSLCACEKRATSSAGPPRTGETYWSKFSEWPQRELRNWSIFFSSLRSLSS